VDSEVYGVLDTLEKGLVTDYHGLLITLNRGPPMMKNSKKYMDR